MLYAIGWLLLALVFKTAFGKFAVLNSVIPSSTALVLFGMMIGATLWVLNRPYREFAIEPDTFFVFLLAPIIFDAGYFMPSRAFFSSILTVVVFVMVLTIWNTVAIGLSLHLLSHINWIPSISLVPIFLFSSLLSASDPVTVMSALRDIHVNDFLFVHVLGEAIFSNAISVAIFNLVFDLYTNKVQLTISAYLIGSLTAALVYKTIASVILGIGFAILSSLLTRFSANELTVSPVFIYVLPYLSFIVAHTLSLSPIITIAVCGIVMRRYVEGNVSRTTSQTISDFTKILSDTCEAVVFLFLGLSAFSKAAKWSLVFNLSKSSVFILFTILLTYLCRSLISFPLCYLCNLCKASEKTMKMKEQLIMSYSALRGPTAFFLVASLPYNMDEKPLFVTATLVIVYINLFFQGITIRPLVKHLNIDRKVDTDETPDQVKSSEKKVNTGRLITWFESINSKYIDKFLINGSGTSNRNENEGLTVKTIETGKDQRQEKSSLFGEETSCLVQIERM